MRETEARRDIESTWTSAELAALEWLEQTEREFIVRCGRCEFRLDRWIVYPAHSADFLATAAPFGIYMLGQRRGRVGKDGMTDLPHEPEYDVRFPNRLVYRCRRRCGRRRPIRADTALRRVLDAFANSPDDLRAIDVYLR